MKSEWKLVLSDSYQTHKSFISDNIQMFLDAQLPIVRIFGRITELREPRDIGLNKDFEEALRKGHEGQDMEAWPVGSKVASPTRVDTLDQGRFAQTKAADSKSSENAR